MRTAGAAHAKVSTGSRDLQKSDNAIPLVEDLRLSIWRPDARQAIFITPLHFVITLLIALPIAIYITVPPPPIYIIVGI